MTSLHNIGLAHCLNILVVSDHGAAPASCSSTFYLESFVPDITKKANVFTGAVGRLRAANDSGKGKQWESRQISNENFYQAVGIYI